MSSVTIYDGRLAALILLRSLFSSHLHIIHLYYVSSHKKEQKNDSIVFTPIISKIEVPPEGGTEISIFKKFISRIKVKKIILPAFLTVLNEQCIRYHPQPAP